MNIFPVKNNFQVKLIAATLMVVDHASLVFDFALGRILGRLSFPLFLWIVVQGSVHTKNFRAYQYRLLGLAVISQPLVFSMTHRIILNPVFNLWLVLWAIWAIDRCRGKLVYLIVFASVFTSYGPYGIALGLLFKKYPFFYERQRLSDTANKITWWLAFILLNLIWGVVSPIQMWALAFGVFVPALHSVRKRGCKARWFYWIYPLHIVGLLLFQRFMVASGH